MFSFSLLIAGSIVDRTGPARAEEPRAKEPRAEALRLPDAVARAVRKSPAIAASGADVAAAESTAYGTRGLDDLLLDGSLTWLQLRRPLISGAPVQQPAFDDVLGTVSLTQPLPSGGRLGLRLSTDYSRTEYATDVGMGPQRSLAEVTAPSLQLFAQHPLLRGLGPKVARAARRRAHVQRDAAGLSREAAVANVLRDVVQGYWDLYYAERELAIRRDAAESARDQLRRVRANIDVGKQPPSAAAEVEVAVALRDEAAMTAEQAAAERSLELARLMGESQDGARRLLSAQDTPALPPPGAADEDGALVREAIERSPQLALTRNAGRAAQIEVDVTESGMLPQLDLSLSGGTIGNSADPREAFSQLASTGSYSVTAGLVFQWPLQNRGARGARDAAHHALRRARLSEADIRGQVTTTVSRLLIAARAARRRAAVLAAALPSAQQDLEAERARFEAGRSTNFDVLRRQEEVAQVQLAQVRAEVDHERAVAAAEAVSGRILDRYALRVR